MNAAAGPGGHRPASPRLAAPGAGGAGANHNLPRPLTSFVGRERRGGRGAGGAGRAPPGHPDRRGRLREDAPGARRPREAASPPTRTGSGWWSWRPLADSALVPQTALVALGLRELPGRPHLATLIEHLRTRALLLVLDNCEHLVDACAAAGRRPAAGLSRPARAGHQPGALARRGRGGFPRALARRPRPARPAADRSARPRYDAVRLFVERARLARPDFALTAQNARGGGAGVPPAGRPALALELAAARVRVLPPEQIAARLDDRFRLLTGGVRTALPRQQTLRGGDRLEPRPPDPGRAGALPAPGGVRRRLDARRRPRRSASTTSPTGSREEGRSPMPAPRTSPGRDPLRVRPSARETCSTSCPAWWTSRSWSPTTGRAAAVRYRLLETIRQYAGEQLSAAGEGPAARRAAPRLVPGPGRAGRPGAGGP